MRIWQRHKSLWVNTGLFCVRESKGLVRSSNQLWESKEVFIQSCKKKLVESRSRWFRPDFTILISRPRTWKGILGLGDVCFSQIILFCVRQKKINDEKKCRSESPRSVITDNLESTWKKKFCWNFGGWGCIFHFSLRFVLHFQTICTSRKCAKLEYPKKKKRQNGVAIMKNKWGTVTVTELKITQRRRMLINITNKRNRRDLVILSSFFVIILSPCFIKSRR